MKAQHSATIPRLGSSLVRNLGTSAQVDILLREADALLGCTLVIFVVLLVCADQ